MAPLHFKLFFSFILVASHVADSVKVIVGDQFQVPVGCEPGEPVTLLRGRLDGAMDVIIDQSGQRTVSREEYRDRIKTDSSNIVFSHTLYTDGGIYELTCSEKTIQLEVIVASKVSVTRGETVILPCYYKTIRGSGLPGRWDKNGKPLCVKNSDSDACSGTPAARLSVSTDWITSGDLSLTIEGAQPEDSGDYFCSIQDGERSTSGTPAAVRLDVTEKASHQMINNSTAAPGDPTQSCAEQTQPWQISTGILAAILLILLVLYLWRSGKLRCDSGKLYEMVPTLLRCQLENTSV